MYTWSHTVSTTASPEQVWPLYADVRRWLEWDGGLVAVTLDGVARHSPWLVSVTGLNVNEERPRVAGVGRLLNRDHAGFEAPSGAR